MASADKVKRPPSEYYYESIYGCFFDDPHGLKSLESVGVDNITFETDYPHSDSTWPHSLKVAMDIMEGLDDETDRQDRPHQRDPHAPPRPRRVDPSGARPSSVLSGVGSDGGL